MCVIMGGRKDCPFAAPMSGWAQRVDHLPLHVFSCGGCLRGLWVTQNLSGGWKVWRWMCFPWEFDDLSLLKFPTETTEIRECSKNHYSCNNWWLSDNKKGPGLHVFSTVFIINFNTGMKVCKLFFNARLLRIGNYCSHIILHLFN